MRPNTQNLAADPPATASGVDLKARWVAAVREETFTEKLDLLVAHKSELFELRRTHKELLDRLDWLQKETEYLAPAMLSEVTVGLSPREQHVLQAIADGKQIEQIAGTLFISVETVRTHLRNAMRKTGTKTRTAAVAEGFRRGFLR